MSILIFKQIQLWACLAILVSYLFGYITYAFILKYLRERNVDHTILPVRQRRVAQLQTQEVNTTAATQPDGTSPVTAMNEVTGPQGIYVSPLLNTSSYSSSGDPLTYPSVHLSVCNLLSLIWIFLAVPFAPSHSVKDWFRGYIYSEVKLQLENMLMFVDVIYFISYQQLSTTYFYAVLFFACTQFVLNLSMLLILNQWVKKDIRQHDIYTNIYITQLFKRLCANLKTNIRKQRGEMEGDVEKSNQAVSPLVSVLYIEDTTGCQEMRAIPLSFSRVPTSY